MKIKGFRYFLLVVLLLGLAGTAMAQPGGVSLPEDARELLPLYNGQVLYARVRNVQEHPAVFNAIGLLDVAGKSLWVREMPDFRLSWRGLNALFEGGFVVFADTLDGQQQAWYFQDNGDLSAAINIPNDIKPVMATATGRLLGTRQGQEAALVEITSAGVEPMDIPGLSPESTVLWTQPQGLNTLLWTRSPLSQEEDFTKRRADCWLTLLSPEGEVLLQATLKSQRVIAGFGVDAALTPRGGMFFIEETEQPNQSVVHCIDEMGQPLWKQSLNSSMPSFRLSLLEALPAGGYALWGYGSLEEGGMQPVVFRIDMDEQGKLRSVDVRQSDGLPVRYTGGQVYIKSRSFHAPTLVPFETLPPAQAEFTVP